MKLPETHHAPPTASEVRAEATSRMSAVKARATGVVTEDDAEPDDDAAPAGAGWCGTCAPLQVGSGSRTRCLNDGNGLCSPGRWEPEDRELPDLEGVLLLRGWVKEFLVSLKATTGRAASEWLSWISSGRVSVCPFPEEGLLALREKLAALLESYGLSPRRRAGDRSQKVETRLLGAFLEYVGDPDFKVLAQFAVGVRIEVGVRMPRTPAVFERQTKWSLPSQATADEADWGRDAEGAWNSNYETVEGREAAIEEKLMEQSLADPPQVVVFSEFEAWRRFGRKLCVASLGAQVKEVRG
jgi:hypothetical protein